MSWPVRRRRQWWQIELTTLHPLTAALAGFAFCYLIGVVFMFHFLTTIGYTWQMAAPRAALWMWTARVGTDMVQAGIVDGTVKIKKPTCEHGATWC